MILAGLLSLALAADPDALRLEASVVQDRGDRGSVLLLWPRVIPHTTDLEVEAAAAALQTELERIVERALPLVERQLAPAPERVCPRATGCRAHTLGVLIGQERGGCVAVGILGRPDGRGLELVPLAGGVTLSASRLPFRAHPEDVVTVREFVPCRDLLGSLDDAALIAALRRQVHGLR